MALISENMAREWWGDPRAAVGKRIRSTLKDDWREVVGVIADLRDDGIDQKAPTIALLAACAKEFRERGNLRAPQRGYHRPYAAGGLRGILQELRQAVAGVNPNLPLASVQTLHPSMTARWRAPPSPWCCWPSPAGWR